jgi:hypothetical protein
MDSNNALLYVFYGSPRTCANRLKIYRELNPGLLLFGICTDGANPESRYQECREVLDDLWILTDSNPKWCWHNLDKVVCRWFLERGHELEFSKILVVDWDVLLLESVDRWIGQAGPNEVKFIDIRENPGPEKNHWTSLPEFEDYKAFCTRANYKRNGLFSGILFAYACSKECFPRFAQAVVDAAGYCEYRMPSLMFNAGLDLGNFEKPANWHAFANVNGISIPGAVIRSEHNRAGGFQMFHPVYEPYAGEQLRISLVDMIREGSFQKSLSRKFKNLIRRIRGV